jgi:hypothetical protein
MSLHTVRTVRSFTGGCGRDRAAGENYNGFHFCESGFDGELQRSFAMTSSA